MALRAEELGLPSGDGAPALPRVVRELAPASQGDIAIFDADGTLWRGDVADDFTRWMIDEGRLGGERWLTYLRIYRDDPPTGCRYLLTFYRGITRASLAAALVRWWRHCSRRQWIPEVVHALRHLARQGYPIWLVSGSPTDFLLPLCGPLPIRRVVGMDFELDPDGRITGQPHGIPCAGEGKARKVVSLLGGGEVQFCAGNGSLDGPMMELARAAWSVYPNAAFERYSRQRGWSVLPRPVDFVEEEKFLLQD